MGPKAIAAVLLTSAVVAGCGSGTGGPTVPSLAAGGSGADGTSQASPGASSSSVGRPREGYSADRVAQLHAAAQCLRENGVPGYQDPVLTADGHVYTDSRAVEDAGVKLSRDAYDALMSNLRAACGALFTTAGLQPDDESPAPPALVQAGVRAAQCLRQNGLTSMRDPSSETPFTPGHGFGLTNDELPNNGALGKTDPVVQNAFQACRSELDAEIAASTLSSLAHD